MLKYYLIVNQVDRDCFSDAYVQADNLTMANT